MKLTVERSVDVSGMSEIQWVKRSLIYALTLGCVRDVGNSMGKKKFNLRFNSLGAQKTKIHVPSLYSDALVSSTEIFLMEPVQVLHPESSNPSTLSSS